jgi:hypothetical protein
MYYNNLSPVPTTGGVAQNIRVKRSSGLEGDVLPYNARKRSKTTENGNTITTPQMTKTTTRSPEEARNENEFETKRIPTGGFS